MHFLHVQDKLHVLTMVITFCYCSINIFAKGYFTLPYAKRMTFLTKTY